MGSPLITASALSRAFACPASVVMPQVHRPAGEAAEKGTALHAHIEEMLSPPDPMAYGGVEMVEGPEWASEWPAVAVGGAIAWFVNLLTG